MRFHAILFALAAFALAPATHAAAQQPNIIYIVADDLGWKDVGYHGSDIRTPTIDELARGGARMNQFYAQPMCTPTRAALMTGRYPFRYGLQTAVILSAHTYGLDTSEWLLPQALGAAGYDTAIIGKWHLGHADRKYWPRQRGFDYQYGPLIGELDYFTHEQHGVLDWYRNNEPVREPGYTTTLLGDDAVRYIAKHDTSRPFFMYLTFNAPHTPYQAPQEWLDKYSNIEDPSRRAYAASITAMDYQIGRVVAELDRRGIRDNTLIVFQSDNGGTRNAQFAGELDMTNVKLPPDNGPYREGKGTLYEGGMLVPALANWPGHIPAGTEVSGMIHVVDIYPTLVRLAGGTTAKAKPLDGLDVWGAIADGKPSPRTEIVYNVEPLRAAIRQGDWKLVWITPLPQKVELYDLAKDPFEQKNVAAEHPAEVAKLERRVDELAAQAAESLFMKVEAGKMLEGMHGAPVLPED